MKSLLNKHMLIILITTLVNTKEFIFDIFSLSGYQEKGVQITD